MHYNKSGMQTICLSLQTKKKWWAHIQCNIRHQAMSSMNNCCEYGHFSTTVMMNMQIVIKVADLLTFNTNLSFEHKLYTCFNK